jgi:hypothetical protein
LFVNANVTPGYRSVSVLLHSGVVLGARIG